jgi:hypothetical protein
MNNIGFGWVEIRHVEQHWLWLGSLSATCR